MTRHPARLNLDGKQQSIHRLDRSRLDPDNPASVDPANTDPANEAEDAEKLPDSAKENDLTIDPAKSSPVKSNQ